MEHPKIPFRDLETYVITLIFSYIDVDNDNSLTYGEIRNMFHQFDMLEIYNSTVVQTWREQNPNNMNIENFIKFIKYLNRSRDINPRFKILIKFIHFFSPAISAADRERRQLIIDNLFILFDEDDNKSMSIVEYIDIYTDTLKIDAMDFMEMFHRYKTVDTDHGEHLNLEGFRNVVNQLSLSNPDFLDALRSQYYEKALIKLGPFKDKIARLFQFLDKDRSETLDRREVSNLFNSLPHVRYTPELFDTYDCNKDGSLSLEEFTNLCVELNAHFVRNGDHRFISYCSSISEGKNLVLSPSSAQFTDFKRVNQEPIPDLPHSALQIPRTSYTYGQLLEAMQDKRGSTSDGKLRRFDGCSGIHNAARNMSDPGLVEKILIENAVKNCGFRKEQLKNVVSQQEQDVLLQRFLDLLLRIARENKKDSPAEIDYLQWLVKAIKTDMTSTAPRFGFTSSRYNNLLIIVCFLERLSKSAQQLFFNLFIEDNREAYSSDGTGRSVCPPGVMERTLMYFRDIIHIGNSEQLRGQRLLAQDESVKAQGGILWRAVSSSVRYLVTRGRELCVGKAQEEPHRELVLNYERFLQTWMANYAQHQDIDHDLGPIFYFQCYVFEKITKLDPPADNPEDWAQKVDEFCDQQWVKEMFDGGYIVSNKKSHKKRKNSKKSKNCKIQYKLSKTKNKK